MVVEEAAAGVVGPHMVEAEAPVALIKADMAAAKADAAGTDRDMRARCHER